MVYGSGHAVVQAVWAWPSAVRVGSQDCWRVGVKKLPLLVPHEGFFDNLCRVVVEAGHTKRRMNAKNTGDGGRGSITHHVAFCTS